jgi:hypothetical protein
MSADIASREESRLGKCAEATTIVIASLFASGGFLMLSNFSLFAQTLWKVGWITALGPGIVMAVFARRAVKFWCPLKCGQIFRIEGYHTGDFVGEIESLDRDMARVRVIDPMRPLPRVRNRCPFPECIREDFHFGDHEFVRVREGVLLEVVWRAAKWIPILEPSSGGGQLAHEGVIPLQRRATSPPRKERKRA